MASCMLSWVFLCTHIYPRPQSAKGLLVLCGFWGFTGLGVEDSGASPFESPLARREKRHVGGLGSGLGLGGWQGTLCVSKRPEGSLRLRQKLHHRGMPERSTPVRMRTRCMDV